MTTRLMPLAVTLTLILTASIAAQTQDRAPDVTAAVPLSVEVEISRYQGDELVSSRSYVLGVLAVTAGSGEGSLGVSARVPVPAGPPSPGPDGVSRPVPFNHEEVGTRLHCFVRTRGDGRYDVSVEVVESSVVGGDDRTSADAFPVSYPPVFRSFDSSNTLVLRDGQTQRYVAAADPATGETIRVDVTLTVLDQESAP